MDKGIKRAQEGKMKPALYYFDKACRKDTSNLDAFSFKATVLNDLGQLEEAETIFLGLIARKYEDPDTYFNLAGLYIKQNAYDSAIVNMSRAIKLDSADAGYYNRLGLIYKEIGQYELAEPILKKAISINKNVDDVNLNMAEVYYQMAEYDKSLRYFRDILRTDSKNALAYYYIYKIYSRKGKGHDACYNYKMAITNGLTRKQIDEYKEPWLKKCE